MVTKIPLTQGLFALVDDEDAEMVNQYKWSVMTAGRNENTTTYAMSYFGRSKELMHKFITGFREVDHINGNGLDNRKENLRIANRRRNNFNHRKTSKPTSSKYKGVCLDKRRGKWLAYAGIIRETEAGTQRNNLGRFTTEEEAAHAYDAAAREHFGEYAALNFPLPGERSALTGEIVPLVAEENAQEVAA